MYRTLATQEQCRRLVKLVLLVQSQQTDVVSSSPSAITPCDVIYRALHNAQFWESRHLRGTFSLLCYTQST